MPVRAGVLSSSDLARLLPTFNSLQAAQEVPAGGGVIARLYRRQRLISQSRHRGSPRAARTLTVMTSLAMSALRRAPLMAARAGGMTWTPISSRTAAVTIPAAGMATSFSLAALPRLSSLQAVRLRRGASSSSGTRTVRRHHHRSQHHQFCRCSASSSFAHADSPSGKQPPPGLGEWFSGRLLAASLAIYRRSGLC